MQWANCMKSCKMPYNKNAKNIKMTRSRCLYEEMHSSTLEIL